MTKHLHVHKKLKYLIIVADLYNLSHGESVCMNTSPTPIPKIIYVNTPPCVILFEHNPDSFQSWSGTGNVDGVTHSHMYLYTVCRNPFQPTNKNNDT